MSATMDAVPAKRPTYSQAQLRQYFERVSLPAKARILDVSGLTATEQLEYLKTLQRHHLARVPFESLTLHYSWHRIINVDPRRLFKKIVQSPGRGGYCMENNTLFFTVLLSLGFKVYMTGSRVFIPPTGRYTGLAHCLSIIIIGPSRYAVDVGYGANGPVVPLKLEVGRIQPHMAPATVRLRYDGIAQNLWSEDRLWIYEHRTDDEAPWVPQYCFTGSEFLPEDIQVMNLGPSTTKTSWFTQTVVCVRHTTESEQFTGDEWRGDVDTEYGASGVGEEINGVLVMEGRSLKWRENGLKWWEINFKNDCERLRALQVYFGITFAEEEKDAIKGTVGELSEN